MTEGFDPYLQWLGIREPHRPPNHYRLLGLELFESDPDVISNAADRQMAHVRTFQAGPHSAESQRILNELAGAKVCLLNPPKKEVYDAQLRAELASAAPAAMPPLSGEIVPPAIPPPLAPRAAQKLAVVWVTLSVFVAMGVVLAALMVFVLGGGHSREDDRDTARSDETADTADTPDVVHGSQPSPEAGTGEGLKSGKEPKTEPAKQPDAKAPAKTTREPPPKVEPKGMGPAQGEPGKDAKSPKEAAKTPATEIKSGPKPPAEPLPPVDESIQAARAAMIERDPAAARKHLELAEKAAYPADQKKLDRLHDVFDPWQAFWNAVRVGMAECKPGDVLRVGDQSADVVRSGDEALTVRVDGTERKFTLRDLPTALALAIADKKLPQNLANLPKAAFLLVDPKGDPRRAMQFCEQSAGHPGSGLTAELRQALRPKEPPPEPTPAVPRPPARLPVPEAAAQQAARKDVRDVHKARFAQARTPMEKGLLANDLFGEAKETKDNPVARYVLLAEARDLAVAAGDPARLREVTLEMAKGYQVDPLEEQSRALAEASETAMPSPVRASLARAAIDLAKEAIQADAYDAAAQLAKAGFSFATRVSASKGRDLHTIREANELRELIPWHKEQYDLAQQAEKALAQDPNNPKAIQFLGKYYTLVKDRWDRGLPLLLRSEDPALKALAEAEQATRRSPAPPDMVKLAEQWMGAAASLEEPLQRSVRRRALYWYEAALPHLSGLTKERVTQIVDGLKQTESTRRKP